ncbi:hypothetical protein TWF718_006606 [Orbilia javanica]|uniref:Uncharacterized protein n=1 Tax=Orbilia javanica TaxID=47235 RepID=A0AAN8MX53_9PEZI
MVKSKLISTILVMTVTSAHVVLAGGTSSLDRRQDPPAREEDNRDKQDTGPHQVYEWFNQTALAGFEMPKTPKAINGTMRQNETDRGTPTGKYVPGGFQAALQSCLDDFVDESQFCITKYGHATEAAKDAPRGSTAIFCCKGGYAAYLFNYRSSDEENPDVRINCYNAALIANETLSSLLNQDTMPPIFQGAEQPIVQAGDNSSSTHMARSYWSEDKTWGVDIYYHQNGPGSNATDDACPSESPYTWVERGKWADLEETVEGDPADPVTPTQDGMDEGTVTTARASEERTTDTMMVSIQTDTMMLSIQTDTMMLSIQTADPTAPNSARSATRASATPTPSEEPLPAFDKS